VVAAGVTDPAALGALPANARAEPFIPFGPLMGTTSVLVTNGGYGGVMTALAHGVPLVVAGTTEDKAEIANRVAYAGVGRNLRSARPHPVRVAAAVHELVGDSSERRRAATLAARLAEHDAPSEAADLLEQLMARGVLDPVGVA
jgi:UDP:flavonoid glycosyltransferase YjiC (YdhE family)